MHVCWFSSSQDNVQCHKDKRTQNPKCPETAPQTVVRRLCLISRLFTGMCYHGSLGSQKLLGYLSPSRTH
eukprot:4201040-Amphidinium_carterae.1